MNRGIFSTIWLRFKSKIADGELRQQMQKRFSGEPFITCMERQQLLNTSRVAFSNQCQIQLTISEDGRLAVITSVIDNLGKGAAGQAVQNANLMFSFPETTGLI